MGKSKIETIKQGHKLSANRVTGSGKKLNHSSILGRKKISFSYL